MKAFWTIRPAVQAAGGTWRPDLPEHLVRQVVTPCDIHRMQAGPAPADHVHLLVGGVAIASDQPGGAHEHFVILHNHDWVIQRVRSGAAAHEHPVNAVPDFFMSFVYCTDEEFVVLQAAPFNVRVICEAEIDVEAHIGALVSEPWTSAERTAWAQLALSQLGIGLPEEIDRGSRLVGLLLGLLLARRPTSDEGYR